tara:strand:- start:519 stop:629 length:111 start_codon:yes stop_codon:yes gene_type:complete
MSKKEEKLAKPKVVIRPKTASSVFILNRDKGKKDRK